MTRIDIQDVSLDKRCQIANESQADLFVSIHTNAAAKDGWSTAMGWECCIIAKGGQAEIAAGYIHDESIQALGVKDRGIKVANYQVLRDTSMPAVLVEHGFHTNKAEVELLKSDAFRAKCAEADARGICTYFNMPWRPAVTSISIDELKKMGISGITF